MFVTLKYNGKIFDQRTPSSLRASGVPDAIVGGAVKEYAAKAVRKYAEAQRSAVLGARPGKLAARQIKRDIASGDVTETATMTALLAREAAANGLDRAGLDAQETAYATAFAEVMLLIEAIESEAVAAIGALADDASDIEEQVAAALDAAKSAAEAARPGAEAALAAA